MTKITVFRTHDHEFKGFSCQGHAGYANAGEDIVCAGISVLVLNTINSIEAYTADPFTLKTEEENGDIDFRFDETAGYEADLFMKSLVLGLQGIQDSYGKEFLKVRFKEV